MSLVVRCHELSWSPDTRPKRDGQDKTKTETVIIKSVTKSVNLKGTLRRRIAYIFFGPS